MDRAVAADGGLPGNATGPNFAASDATDRAGHVLAGKAACQAWSIERDIDWRLPPARPWWLPRRNHIVLASQFLHGERIAKTACERLLPWLPDGGLRGAVLTQIADEARHVDVHARYLARLGDIAPQSPLLAEAFTHIAGWRGPAVGIVLATHVVLESEALAIQQGLARDFPCPILRTISRLAARDESRHLAIGRILLRSAGLRALPLEERVFLHRRMRRVWEDCTRAAAADHGRVFGRAVGHARLEAGWLRLQARFRAVGLIGDAEGGAFAQAGQGSAG